MIEKDVFFYHIMKTAGTSVARLMESACGTGAMCPLPTHQGADESAFRKKILADHPLVVSGHPDHLFHLWDMAHKRSYSRFVMTFLRHPIDRYISCYNFIAKSKYVNKNVQSVDVSLEEAMQGNDPRMADNMMTKALASLGERRDYTAPAASNDLKKAISNLKQMDFVGVVEEFNISCALLAIRLGMDVSVLERWNVNKKYPTKDELPANTVRRIRLKNVYDLELFHFANNLFQLQVADAGETLKSIMPKITVSETVYMVKQK